MPDQPTREQIRAIWAYDAVTRVHSRRECDFDNYRTLINGFGPNIIRSGLVAAFAFVQRYHDKDARTLFLQQLAEGDALAHVPALADSNGAEKLLGNVRKLPADSYMLATREALRLALWLKRAAQAVKGEA